MTVAAEAKVNLTLEVYGLRADGFHDLRSVVLPIALADELTFEPADSFSTDTGFSDDLILKAVSALSRAVSAPCRLPAFSIRVAKRIPVGGGLGGGSADAAAALRALNVLWKLGKTPEELAQIGAEVGSDVPALVLAQHYRRAVLMEGRGERVSLLGGFEMPRKPMVLATPRVSSSTAEVYARCRVRTERPSGEPWENRVNDLQAAACELHPEIAAAMAAMAVAGAEDVAMSGSGSSVFGFADDAVRAERIAVTMRALGCTAQTTAVLV